MNRPLLSSRSSRDQIRIRKVTISSSKIRNKPPGIQSAFSASSSSKSSFQLFQTPRSAIGLSKINNWEDSLPGIKSIEANDEEDSVILTLNELLTPTNVDIEKNIKEFSKNTVSVPVANKRMKIIAKSDNIQIRK